MHKIKRKEKLQETHIHTREDHVFFQAHSKSGVGLSVLAEMLLGTDILTFDGDLSFLQIIYLGICFTGGLLMGPNPGLM